MKLTPSSDSLSLRLRSSQTLTSLHNITRRSVLQKVRGRAFNALPLLVNTGFQVLFHSPPGVLFTFPSRYYALSVTNSYLALGGGPPCFPPDSSCPAVLWIRPLFRCFAYEAFTLSGRTFQFSSAHVYGSICRPQPLGASSSVWALSLSLAATKEIDVSFSSFRYLDVSVPGVPSVMAMCSSCSDWALPQPGFPIQTSTDQSLLAAPRGFSQLATSFFGVWCLGIHPVLLFA